MIESIHIEPVALGRLKPADEALAKCGLACQ